MSPLADRLHLRVVSAAGVSLDTEAVSVRMTSPRGSFGILPGRAPLLAVLPEGEVRWQAPDGGRSSVRTPGGVVRVFRDDVTLLE